MIIPEGIKKIQSKDIRRTDQVARPKTTPISNN
jgi:hypothetical protein